MFSLTTFIKRQLVAVIRYTNGAILSIAESENYPYRSTVDEIAAISIKTNILRRLKCM